MTNLGFACLCVATLMGASSSAFGEGVSGYLTFGSRFSTVQDTFLVLDPTTKGYVDKQNYVKAVLKYRQGFGDFRLTGQVRAILGNQTQAENGIGDGQETALDELYLDYAATDTTSLFIGRRNLSYGQSFGINPADVFLNVNDLDRSLSPDMQRAEITGVDMVGAEIFFASGGAILAYWAPSTDGLNPDQTDRAYLSYRSTIGASQADLTLFVFDDERPGAGISGVLPFQSGLLLYTDLVWRQGESLPDISNSGDLASLNNAKWEGEATVGLSYTFINGLTVNLEYSHLSGGYDDKNWDNFIAEIDANTPALSPAQGAKIGRLGDIAQTPYLRSNYAFLRLYHPGPLNTGIESELSTLIGLDDGSGTVNLRLKKILSDSANFYLSLSNSFGSKDSEFSRNPERGSFSLGLEVNF